MTSNTLNAVPATVLETMAERLHGQAEPIKIRSNDDHAALAADVLWKFARKTGLNRESESVQTVITDFLANLLHLCEQCDPDGAGRGTAESRQRRTERCDAAACEPDHNLQHHLCR